MRESSTAGVDIDTTGRSASLPIALHGPLAERVDRITADTNALRDYRQAVQAWVPIADERYRCCSYLPPLGENAPNIRVGVKDTVDVAGWPTTLGLPHHRRYAETTAPVLRSLPDDTLFAKLVTTQLSVGRVSGCRNPYFPAIDPAGSSTGSAVAVAANICDVALGSDVLGSVRFPAGCCGVVGLRMTHDPVFSEGLLTVSSMLDSVGWFTRTITDLRFVWEAFGMHRMVVSSGGPHSRTGSIGLVANAFDEDCEAEVRVALRNASALAESAGLGVQSVDLSPIWHARADAWRLCAYDTHFLGKQWATDLDAEFDDSARAAFGLIREVDRVSYDCACETLGFVRSMVRDLFAESGVDAWLLPLSQRLPVAVGTVPSTTSTILDPADSEFDSRLGFTSLASAAGLPAICFPIGVHPQRRIPIPVQLVGPPGSETTLITIAAEITSHLELDLFPS